MAETQGSKAEIRREIRWRRASLTTEEKAWMDKAVLRQVLGFLETERRSGHRFSVYCYVSFGKEADTRNLLSELWKRQIPTAVPRVEGQQLHFYWIHGMEDLQPGFHGILEPEPACKPAADRSALVLVPGAAFSKAGGRLGYGGGFYDRFFMREPEHKKLALAYEFQIMEALPLEGYDVEMDGIVTEERMIYPVRKDQK